MVIQCCVCRKIKVNQHWERRSNPKDTVSSSYCPSCRIETLKGIARERKKAQLAGY